MQLPYSGSDIMQGVAACFMYLATWNLHRKARLQQMMIIHFDLASTCILRHTQVLPNELRILVMICCLPELQLPWPSQVLSNAAVRVSRALGTAASLERAEIHKKLDHAVYDAVQVQLFACICIHAMMVACMAMHGIHVWLRH